MQTQSLSNPVAATIALLQRELDSLRQQVEDARPPTKVRAETQQQEAILSALRGTKGAWLSDLAAATGLSKNVCHTRARALAYKRRVWMSLEPNEKVGKLAFYLRPIGCVVVEE